MNLHQYIKYKVTESELKEISEKLNISLFRTLRILTYPHFGLLNQRFTIDPELFIKVTCEALRFDERDIKNMLNDYYIYLNIQKSRLPYIFIDTEFKRKNQPVLALAAMERKRIIKISIDQLPQNRREELLLISEIVKCNYCETSGELPLWGTIKRYVYHDILDDTYVFNIHGNIINSDRFNESFAFLKIR